MFTAATFVILNLVISGSLALNQEPLGRLKESVETTITPLQTGSWAKDYSDFISHVAFCMLAYSGIESVIQTAGFVRTWREIHKAYLFLALILGLLTPLIAAHALSAPINFKGHEGDLITYYTMTLNGPLFGVAVAALASLTLTMAVLIPRSSHPANCWSGPPLYHRLVELLKVVEYELSRREITIRFGWPMSSWLDRLAIGLMVLNMMRLPRMFPQFRFIISYDVKCESNITPPTS